MENIGDHEEDIVETVLCAVANARWEITFAQSNDWSTQSNQEVRDGEIRASFKLFELRPIAFLRHRCDLKLGFCSSPFDKAVRPFGESIIDR